LKLKFVVADFYRHIHH